MGSHEFLAAGVYEEYFTFVGAAEEIGRDGAADAALSVGGTE
jgi:hypothetical protein